MKANRYLGYNIAILIGAIIAMFVWVLVVQAQVGVPTESSRWIYECAEKKASYARSIVSSKIIITAGSNGLFGVNAAQMEQELGIPTVNMAIHAGLGLDYILKHVQTVAKSGDLILLPFEYEMYNSGATKGNTVIVDYVFSHDIGYLDTIPFKDKVRIYLSVPDERIFEGIKGLFITQPKIFEGYQADTLNRNGDETRNLTPKAEELIRSNNERSKALLKGIKADTPAWEKLTRFKEWADRNNIKIIAGYPALMYQSDYDTEIADNTIASIKNYYKSQAIPVVGTAREFMYEQEYMYDSCYHLNSTGAEIRTKKIIEYLQPYVTDMRR